MRLQGRISRWNDSRGFGFIQPAEGGPEVFVHIKAFVPGYPRPLTGQSVSFEVQQVEGRLRAQRVMLDAVRRLATAPVSTTSRESASGRGLLALPAFVGLWVLLGQVWQLPAILLPVYLCTSVVCLLLYAWDKRAAMAGHRRIPENTLHLWALLGGWPGALVAQQLFRHKSSKRAFRALFWTTVALNIAVFVWYASPLGAAALRPV
jgi:uncharacterized membrane protein YsdA (DUF1294 family)/cold shock CspA family protein